MPSSPSLARSARKIEEMPTDDGSLLDTIAGAIVRLFTRVNQIERVNDSVMRRLAALERAEEAAESTHANGRQNGTATRAARPV